MIREIVGFSPSHLHDMDIQSAQALFQEHLRADPQWAVALDIPEHSYSIMRDGKVLLAGGVVPINIGVCVAWAVLSSEWVTDTFYITYRVREFLDQMHEAGFWRIQITVELDFRNGHRWARILGFSPEGKMRKYGPDGQDHVMYGRVV